MNTDGRTVTEPLVGETAVVAGDDPVVTVVTIDVETVLLSDITDDENTARMTSEMQTRTRQRVDSIFFFSSVLLL